MRSISFSYPLHMKMKIGSKPKKSNEEQTDITENKAIHLAIKACYSLTITIQISVVLEIGYLYHSKMH